MKNGGYIMIDGGAIDPTTFTPTTITGAYAEFSAAIESHKMVLIVNVSDYSPIPAVIAKTDDGISINTIIFNATVTENDEFTVIEPE